MKSTTVKTTLSDVNHGHCGSPNNCRYTGRSRVWAIVWTCPSGERVAMATNREWLAEDFARYLKSVDSREGDSVNDLSFLNHGKYAARYASSNPEVWLEPCFVPEALE